MEDQFSDSPDFSQDASFAEANKVIHSACNSAYAIQQAKNIIIRKQLLESAIQKLLESRTFYISDVRDIAAMNNRPFDSRSKLYEQLNILNCREYRKMRAAVLELLPLMIHRATGIAEERFTPIVDANRVDRAAVPAGDAAASAPVTPSASAEAAASQAVKASAVAGSSASGQADAPTAGAAADKAHAPAASRPWALMGSMAMNLMMGAAVLITLMQQGEPAPQTMISLAPPFTNSNVLPAALINAPVAGSKPLLVDSVVHTATPAASLSEMAASLPQDRTANRQYRVGVQIEQVGGK